jgi:hypothetical protein
MRTMVPEIKEKSATHSAARMAALTEVDQIRIEAEREAMRLQGLRDLELLRNIKIAFGIFLALLAIISLIVLL